MVFELYKSKRNFGDRFKQVQTEIYTIRFYIIPKSQSQHSTHGGFLEIEIFAFLKTSNTFFWRLKYFPQVVQGSKKNYMLNVTKIQKKTYSLFAVIIIDGYFTHFRQ